MHKYFISWLCGVQYGNDVVVLESPISDLLQVSSIEGQIAELNSLTIGQVTIMSITKLE